MRRFTFRDRILSKIAHPGIDDRAQYIAYLEKENKRQRDVDSFFALSLSEQLACVISDHKLFASVNGAKVAMDILSIMSQINDQINIEE